MNVSSLRKIISQAAVALSVALLPANIAFAEAADAGGGLMSLAPLVLIMVIFWVLLIRPQQKKMKAHGEMLKAIKKGDKIVTGGGFLGQVMDVKEQYLVVEIAEGVRVKVRQDTILDMQNNDKAVTTKAATK